MMRILSIGLGLAGAMLAATPGAAAGSFTLVNGTDRAMADVSIRRFGARDFRPLGLAIPPGGKAPVPFTDPDCAFDISAALGGGLTAIWSGVNLCEVSVVVVRRRPSGELWVEYD